MTTIDPSGYSEAGAHLFTWLADKVLGGAKKAFGWDSKWGFDTAAIHQCVREPSANRLAAMHTPFP